MRKRRGARKGRDTGTPRWPLTSDPRHGTMDIETLNLAALWPLAVRMIVAASGALLILLVFVLVSWAVKAAVRRIARARRADQRDVINLIGTALRWTILAVGLVTALGTLGVDVSGLIAGLGLTGFALGFALRDIISSILAGILIMLNRPFAAGDYIRLPTVAGIEGTVAAIELRYTVVSDADGQRHLVPNAKVLSEVVSLRPRAPGV
jgi:small conductance mechanosensitive channel